MKLTKRDLNTTKDMKSEIDDMQRLIRTKGKNIDKDEVGELQKRLRRLRNEEDVLRRGLELIPRQLNLYKLRHTKQLEIERNRLHEAKDKRFKPGPRTGLEFYDEDLKCTVKRNTFIDGHARAKQIVHSHYVFELLQDGKVIDTKTEHLELSYLSDNQAQDLFKKAGFRIKKSYGAYDKSPIDEDNKHDLIYVLQKK